MLGKTHNLREAIVSVLRNRIGVLSLVVATGLVVLGLTADAEHFGGIRVMERHASMMRKNQRRVLLRVLSLVLDHPRTRKPYELRLK